MRLSRTFAERLRIDIAAVSVAPPVEDAALNAMAVTVHVRGGCAPAGQISARRLLSDSQRRAPSHGQRRLLLALGGMNLAVCIGLALGISVPLIIGVVCGAYVCMHARQHDQACSRLSAGTPALPRLPPTHSGLRVPPLLPPSLSILSLSPPNALSRTSSGPVSAKPCTPNVEF